VRQAKKGLLLLWLFRQGTRITDALGIKVADLDIPNRTVIRRIGKTDENDVVEALSDDVWQELVNNPPVGTWLFPWRTKSGVYRWLRPYMKQIGVKFTPHMARHSLGKWLNESGVSLRTIMDTLHHHDPKSSVRYQSTDAEAIRAAGRRIGKLGKGRNAP
jgi:integrase